MKLTTDDIIKYIETKYMNKLGDMVNEGELITLDSSLSAFHDTIKIAKAYNEGAKIGATNE